MTLISAQIIVHRSSLPLLYFFKLKMLNYENLLINFKSQYLELTAHLLANLQKSYLADFF
jgi:hypothetical protein